MMTMRERIATGKLFTDYCEGLPEDRQQAKRRMIAFNATGPDDLAARSRLRNEIFGRETNAWIEPPFYFCYGTNIEIGDSCYINFNCNFVDDGKIILGSKVMFGPAVTIATVGHPLNPHYRAYMYTDPVRIADNCWIGAGSIICPGVTISENRVIGAGSVATKDIAGNSVTVSHPCRVLRTTEEHDMQYSYQDRARTVDDPAEEAGWR